MADEGGSARSLDVVGGEKKSRVRSFETGAAAKETCLSET